MRTAVITGATSGLGLHAARTIAADPGWHVVLTSRSQEAAGAAATTLGERSTPMRLELASLADVRRFAAELAARTAPAGGDLPPLGAIVANAGVQTVRPSYTEDGFETTFAVNHLGHFLLVNLLLPHLAEAARVVLVASDTHDPRRPTGMPAPRYAEVEALAHPPATAEEEKPRAARRRYTTSKLCNVLTGYELARRLADAGSTVRSNAFDPGLMPGTGLAREYSGITAFAWRRLLPALTVLPFGNVHTPGRSGAALARLVTDPGLAEVTGRYFSGRREIPSSEESYDVDKAAELWRGSAKLVDIS